MKNIVKKHILLFAALMLAVSSLPTYAISNKSEWAQDAINLANECGIIPRAQYSGDYTKAIQRGEIAELIVNAYENITAKEYSSKSSPFSDASADSAAAAVFELGIMNGKGNGKFDSYSHATREEMSKIILLFKSVAENEKLSLPSDFHSNFTDFDEIGDWAKPYVAKAAEECIINGYDDGRFAPKETVSWEMAISLVIRTVELNPKENAVVASTEREKRDLFITCDVSEAIGDAKIEWKKMSDGEYYTINVTEQRMPYYEEDIPPNETVTYEIEGENFLSIGTVPNRKYVVEIFTDTYFDICEFYTDAVYNEDAQEILESYPTSQEEAEPLMTTVTVPVWRLKGDEKVSSTAEITVHNKIAEKIKLVFEEIYNGEEQFPIKDIGGYAWRGGRSEHNGGTAIDINANENYCVYSNGTVIGSHWKPYEDTYSITPYGDVIRAFEKYGFTWGGDAWANPKDYMHFSYLGT